VFEGGKLVQSSLTREGQGYLGPLVERWQTEGIQIREQMDVQENGLQVHVLGMTRVLLTSSQAQVAFHCWGSDEGHILVPLPERLIPSWEKICGLTLEPEERFGCLQALRYAPHQLAQAWDETIDRVMHNQKMHPAT
jgi:hypothetical protein